MKDLLYFLVTKIAGLKKVEIKEDIENDHVSFLVLTEPGKAGLVIGKSGKTIKAIRALLRVRATLEKKGVSVSVEETS